MNERIWLNRSILQYECYPCSSTSVPPNDWQQQYEIYSHAEYILEKNPNTHDLACVVFQLNRAIDFREKLLNKQYSFKKIPGFQGKKQHETMRALGIIKPLLKTKLDKIRNNVMHSAEYPPPKLSEVAELAEFTWYFLKSTDLIASRNVSALLFNDSPYDDQDEWAEISFDLINWEISIRGRFLDHNIINNSAPDFMEITTDKKEKKENSTYVSGKIIGPSGEVQDIVRAYFKAM